MLPGEQMTTLNQTTLFGCTKFFFVILIFTGTMKQLYMSLVACVFIVVCFISHGHGAAVMSIDLGSEWMKVNFTERCSLVCDNLIINVFLTDWCCVTGCANGNCFKQRV